MRLRFLLHLLFKLIISIHAPRAGCDGSAPARYNAPQGFQSTHPVRGATRCAHSPPTVGGVFQSTHPVRGATGAGLDYLRSVAPISIHAPRAGCDAFLCATIIDAPTISIHAPRAGCDVLAWFAFRWIYKFQSTHPVRGATYYLIKGTLFCHNFNPRTPCGVRRTSSARGLPMRQISIHAPRAGCDGELECIKLQVSNFNPRTPCGVRLRLDRLRRTGACNFNPRTPCGVRPVIRRCIAVSACGFQSTHPVRGATWAAAGGGVVRVRISIHAPRAGCDCKNLRQAAGAEHFNPRTPCGVRHAGLRRAA